MFPFQNPALPLDERLADLSSRLTFDEKTRLLLHDAPGIERLGINPYPWWSECRHGVARNGRATLFPQAIAMAATFDTGLFTRIGTAISDEARAIYRMSVARKNFAATPGSPSGRRTSISSVIPVGDAVRKPTAKIPI